MPADPPEDVASSINLKDPTDAYRWVAEAELKRPWREELRGQFVELLRASSLPVRRVLEIGSGPGLLAERILRSCDVEQYTLFDSSRPMLKLSRERVGPHPAATFVFGDFREHGWTESLGAFVGATTHQVINGLYLCGAHRETSCDLAGHAEDSSAGNPPGGWRVTVGRCDGSDGAGLRS